MSRSRQAKQPAEFPPLLATIQPYLPETMGIWLVGGAVRDLLLGRESRDLDLAVADEARKAARQVANGLGADYYDLDKSRDTGRVLVDVGDGNRVTLDFTRLDPEGIEADLTKRDFTINALAICLGDPGVVVDVTHGMDDLDAGIVRACSLGSISDDPIRSLRAVRLAHELGFNIEPGTLKQIPPEAERLNEISAERLRDELYRILAIPSAGDALRECSRLQLLSKVLPDLASLDGLVQPAPHEFDGLEHSLRVAGQLARWLGGGIDGDDLWRQLEPFSSRVRHHLASPLAMNRHRSQVLVLAGLLHDVGKPAVAEIGETGKPQFHGHEAAGAEMAWSRAEALHLSRSEAAALKRTIANHMRPGQLAKQDTLTGRAVYRFFRATGDEGVDICLLALADLVGQSASPPDSSRWEARLRVVHRLLEAYYERSDQEVTPESLVNGDDLMKVLDLAAGPLIGKLLEAIRQEQAEGTIRSREEALAFATRQVRNPDDINDGEAAQSASIR